MMRKRRPKKFRAPWTGSSGEREWEDPRYKKWRKDIKERDGYKCQWPFCQSNKKLQAHHIKSWSKYPNARFLLNNGITLCQRHHKLVFRKEEQYASLFLRILNRDKKEPPK